MVSLPKILRPPEIGAADVAAINALLAELRPNAKEAVSLADVRAVATAGALIVVRDAAGTIVGMATLALYRKLGGIVGRIEDVVVAASAQRRGLGRALMGEVIRRAREEGATRLDLTSNDKRTAAHALYRSLGFVRAETNVFRMAL
ncbi:MAG: GNAT family N-acetyltransferase [Bauldia sp.]